VPPILLGRTTPPRDGKRRIIIISAPCITTHAGLCRLSCSAAPPRPAPCVLMRSDHSTLHYFLAAQHNCNVHSALSRCCHFPCMQASVSSYFVPMVKYRSIPPSFNVIVAATLSVAWAFGNFPLQAPAPIHSQRFCPQQPLTRLVCPLPQLRLRPDRLACTPSTGLRSSAAVTRPFEKLRASGVNWCRHC